MTLTHADPRHDYCGACGYDLSDCEAGTVSCPECGANFGAVRPWRPSPWPGWGTAVVSVLGPGIAAAPVVFGGAFVLPALVYAPWWIAHVAAGVVMVLLTMVMALSVMLPRAAAARFVRQHLPPPGAEWKSDALGAPGMLFAAVCVVGAAAAGLVLSPWR